MSGSPASTQLPLTWDPDEDDALVVPLPAEPPMTPVPAAALTTVTLTPLTAVTDDDWLCGKLLDVSLPETGVTGAMHGHSRWRIQRVMWFGQSRGLIVEQLAPADEVDGQRHMLIPGKAKGTAAPGERVLGEWLIES